MDASIAGPTTTRTPNIALPHFHILCMHSQAATAFTTAIGQYPTLASNVNFTIHESALSSLTTDINFDLVVSPANSYGILDGSFDDAISRAFSPKDAYHALTRHVQAELYREYKGYLPPGSCHIVRIPAEWKEIGRDGKSRLRYGDGKGWGCKWIAMVPTMRVPMVLCGEHEVVYNCVWSLLAALERHNRDASEADQVRSILMTPLATGVGRVTYKKWADQCVLAMKHYVEACETPGDWARISWRLAERIDAEVEPTTKTRRAAERLEAEAEDNTEN